MRLKFIITIPLLLNFTIIYSQFSHLFTNLTVQTGLNSNVANSIVQDKYGFIWIGTEEGVARFDGNQVIKFKNNGTQNSIPSNNISCLLYDNQYIWIGTWNGLAKINIETFEIKQINIGQTKVVRALFKDSKDQVWIGTANGILVFNEKENSYVYYNSQNSQISHNTIRAFSETIDGSIWIGTYDGLNRFKNNKFENIYLKGDRKPLISNDLILKITQSLNNDSTIWIGTETGLINFNIYTTNSRHYNLDNINLSNEVIKCIYQQNDSLLWLGTDFGLNVINLNTNKVNNHFHDPLQNHTIANNVIWEIFEDKNKRIWFITSGGTSFINSATPDYLMHEIFNSTNHSRAGNQVKSMLTDDLGNLWMATMHGVIRKNIKKGTEKHFTTTSPLNERILLDNVYALEKDKYGRIWIGTAGGINIWNEKTRKMKSITANKQNGLTSNYISGFAITNDNSIWVSAWEGGLFKISGDIENLNNLKFIEIDKNDQGKFVTNGENLFVASGNEFWEINTKNLQKQNIINVEQITEDVPITSYLYRKNGTIWLGLEDKIIEYLPKNDSLKIIELQNIISSKIINLIEDKTKNIFATTYNSIIKFDTKTQNQTTIPINTDTYFKGFYNHSSTLFDNKTIYFGGDNGYIEINPEQIQNNQHKSEIFISSFYINNQQKSPLDINRTIEKDINFIDEIKLKYNENSISLDLTTLDFISPKSSQFSYRLLPVENSWNNTTGQRNIVSYSNIKPGKYKLQIKGKSIGGSWSDTKEIAIIITPHILFSKPFIVLYIVIIISMIYLFLNIYNTRHKIKNEIEIVKLQSENDKKIYESKINFFTNISHEFRTPLTLILPPIKQVLNESQDAEQKHILQLAYKNSLRLSKLVNQLLDLRKIETSEIKLNQSITNLNNVCKDVFSSFSDIANRNEIKYNLIIPEKDTIVNIDKEKIEIVFFNILSNAFKFTNFGGKITFTINYSEELIITIEDDGIGISKKEINKIFEQFYQTSNSNKTSKAGSGIGLTLAKQYVQLHNGAISVESEENKGTKFIINLTPAISNSSEIENIEEKNIKESERQTEINNILQKKILVVDDNLDILDYIKWNLQHKYIILTSTNGQEALKEIEKEQPHLIISDISMPVMDGIELCSKIKNDKTTAHIPVILLTAKTYHEHKLEGINSGASLYITKPFEIDFLKSSINSIFEREKELTKFIKNQILISPTKDETLSNDEQFISKVMSIIENNIANPNLSVEFIANQTNISSTHLYRKIKEITGLSTKDIITNYRLEKAKQILENKELNVTETMYAVGFSSISAFSRSFKNKYGITPGSIK